MQHLLPWQHWHPPSSLSPAHTLAVLGSSSRLLPPPPRLPPSLPTIGRETFKSLQREFSRRASLAFARTNTLEWVNFTFKLTAWLL
jgi:hypothetical protein